MILVIRREEEIDFDFVYNLVKEAFETAEHSGGNEQDLVNSLRKSTSFVPELSLVAEKDGKIVGHIMFTEAKVGENTVLALAPLSVHPDYQNKGIGSALIEEGHRIAKNMKYYFSVVLGSEKYYPKFGYKKACDFGIKAPFDVPDENFMCIELNGFTEKLNGTMVYADEFNIA